MDSAEYFLDTNVFLRAIVKDHPKQSVACQEILRLLRDGSIAAVTSSVVLAEIVWTADSYYALEKSVIADTMEGIASVRALRIDDRVDALRAVEYFRAYNIKFVDALIAAHPRVQAGAMSVVSYDKDFDKLQVRRIEPLDLLDHYARHQQK